MGGIAKSEGEQLLNRQPLSTSPVCKALGSLWELPGFLLEQPLPISWVVGCVLRGRAACRAAGGATKLVTALQQRGHRVTFPESCPWLLQGHTCSLARPSQLLWLIAVPSGSLHTPRCRALGGRAQGSQGRTLHRVQRGANILAHELRWRWS